MDQPDGTTAASVPGCGPGFVLLTAALHILGDPGVKRAIGTAKNVDEPGLTDRFLHFGFMTLFDSSSCRKHPTK
jgi:hypothetical protein